MLGFYSVVRDWRLQESLRFAAVYMFVFLSFAFHQNLSLADTPSYESLLREHTV